VDAFGVSWVAPPRMTRPRGRGDEGSKGVEGLARLSGWRRWRRTDDGDVGINGHLNDGHSGGKDDERSEEDAEDSELGGRDESGGSAGHDEQADDHGLLVAELLDDSSAG